MRPKQMPMTGSTTRRGQSHSSSSPSHPMRRASLAASAHGLPRTFGRAERTRHGVRSCNWSRNQSSARSISRAAGRADPNCCLYSSRLLARRLVLVVLVLIEEDLTREAASNHMRMLRDAQAMRVWRSLLWPENVVEPTLSVHLQPPREVTAERRLSSAGG